MHWSALLITSYSKTVDHYLTFFQFIFLLDAVRNVEVLVLLVLFKWLYHTSILSVLKSHTELNTNQNTISNTACSQSRLQLMSLCVESISGLMFWVPQNLEARQTAKPWNRSNRIIGVHVNPLSWLVLFSSATVTRYRGGSYGEDIKACGIYKITFWAVWSDDRLLNGSRKIQWTSNYLLDEVRFFFRKILFKVSF